MRPVASFLRFAFLALALSALGPIDTTASPGPTTPSFLLRWGSPSEFAGLTGVDTDASGNVYFVEFGGSTIHKCDRWGNPLASWSAPVTRLTVSPAGNVYATDYYNHHVLEYSSSGTLIRTWGTAGSGPGQFQNPLGIATDRAGNVYVADSNNGRVQKFTSTGTYVTSFSNAFGLQGPGDLVVGPDGTVVVLDYQNYIQGRVVRFSSAGAYLGAWALPAGDYSRSGLGMDAFGHVLVADETGNQVRKYEQDGTPLASWGTAGSGDGQFSGPYDVSVDAAGNVYVSEYFGQRMHKFSGSGESPLEGAGTWLLKMGTFGSGAGQMNGPWGTCTDAAGNVYVSDTQNHRVQKYSSTGTFLQQWGSFGTGNGQFNLPRGIAVDVSGNVFVVDGGNHRVQKFTSAGVYLGQWGSLGSGNGQFNSPAGVAVNAAGTVFVTDYGNHRVQRFTNAGAYVVSWGVAGSGNGQFNGPFGIGVDASHQVYVMDQNNARVQKFGEFGDYISQWNGAGLPGGAFSNAAGLAVDAYGHVFVADYGYGRVACYTSNGYLLSYWGSTGAANGQMAAPIGIATDALGNVYVADTNNSRVQKFVMPPSLAFVSDVGNDQGRQVTLRFLRCSADAAGVGATVTGYEVYRRIDPLPGLPPLASGARNASAPNAAQLAGWSWVTTVPAHGDSEYNVVVPTLADATASSSEYTAFLVRAVTTDPLTFFGSGVETGCSIDNLAPPTPAPFLAAYQAGITHLHWAVSPAADFETFRLYRGADANFVPGAGNFVAATPDTGYLDPGAAGRWYKLTAVDRNGNESVYATLGPAQTTDVASPGESREFALACADRNPSSDGRLTVRFSLARAGTAQLDVMDVTGRRVAESRFPDASAGRQVVTLGDGRRFAPGIYLVTLRQGEASRTLRLTVLR